MDISEAIRNSYLARGLSEDQVKDLSSLAQERSYKAGVEILQQFEQSQDLLLLVSGTAHILSVLGEPIGLIKPGMPIGEVSFIDGRPRSGTVVALEDCGLVFFAESGLRTLLKSRPDIAVVCLQNVCLVLCARLRATTKHLAALMAIEEVEASPSSKRS